MITFVADRFKQTTQYFSVKQAGGPTLGVNEKPWCNSWCGIDSRLTQTS